jgi:hypothetical protein
MGDIVGAIVAMEKAKIHLQRAGGFEEYRKGYEYRISLLHKKKGK